MFISVLSEPYKQDKINNIIYSQGSGTMFDAMYLIDVGGWFIGPQLSWIQVKYKRYSSTENNNLEDVFISMDQTDIQPYLGVLYSF